VTRRALPDEWQVLHVSGERDYEYMRAEERQPFGENRVVLLPYLSDMADAYALCDLMVGRAGASTLGEVAALGVPSILVPYPFASDNHQLRNARAFEAAGACIVVEDRDLNADSLWWTLRSAMEPDRLKTMREAARSLAPGDPVAMILARIDALTSRRTQTT
jgi:UDP-N-acetylglucosamine--N-acetylmuramyl-(pentapeptide) pyrophosphoryl-undecaprenol N-acetylglucosamine transferase